LKCLWSIIVPSRSPFALSTWSVGNRATPSLRCQVCLGHETRLPLYTDAPKKAKKAPKDRYTLPSPPGTVTRTDLEARREVLFYFTTKWPEHLLQRLRDSTATDLLILVSSDTGTIGVIPGDAVRPVLEACLPSLANGVFPLLNSLSCFTVTLPFAAHKRLRSCDSNPP
jgi:hypothetical protein